MYKLYRAYFAVALLLGFHKHVFRVSSSWGEGGRGVSKEQYSAAHAATQMLIDDGYPQCPYCQWATERKDEHVSVVGTYCHEEHFLSLRRRRREGTLLQPESVALLATLSRVRHSLNHDGMVHFHY